MNRSDTATTRVITGYEVFRFGVPMIGEYVNALRGETVTISSAVPGAQYRITAWALDSGTRRSNTSAVKIARTGDKSELQTSHKDAQLDAPYLYYTILRVTICRGTHFTVMITNNEYYNISIAECHSMQTCALALYA